MNDLSFVRPVIVIAGPTASGKSSLALKLADLYNGTIINADSMQVYQGLPILTSQPSVADMQRAPHKLYAVLKPDEACSAGRWRDLVLAAIHEALQQKRWPIVVGGTGLYIRALLQGIVHIPEIPHTVRTECQALMARVGIEQFYQHVMQVDPTLAVRLRPTDKQRLLRAYEVYQHTGTPLSAWQQEVDQPGLGDAAWTILVHPPRQDLYRVIDQRFVSMVQHGALDEVKALMKLNLPPQALLLKALGVAEIRDHLAGRLTHADMLSRGQQLTRNYAKRQYTWFRHQFKAQREVSHVGSLEAADVVNLMPVIKNHA